MNNIEFFKLKEYEDWNNLLNLSGILFNKIPPFNNEIKRELYFRAVLYKNYNVIKKMLKEEFELGPNSLYVLLYLNSKAQKYSYLIDAPIKDISKLSLLDFVFDKNASNSVSYCEISNILENLDPYSNTIPLTYENVLTDSIALKFISNFWQVSIKEKKQLIKDMVRLIPAAVKSSGNIKSKASSVYAGLISLKLLYMIKNGIEKFDHTTANIIFNISQYDYVFENILSLEKLALDLYELRKLIMLSELPTLDRLNTVYNIDESYYIENDEYDDFFIDKINNISSNEKFKSFLFSIEKSELFNRAFTELLRLEKSNTYYQIGRKYVFVTDFTITNEPEFHIVSLTNNPSYKWQYKLNNNDWAELTRSINLTLTEEGNFNVIRIIEYDTEKNIYPNKKNANIIIFSYDPEKIITPEDYTLMINFRDKIKTAIEDNIRVKIDSNIEDIIPLNNNAVVIIGDKIYEEFYENLKLDSNLIISTNLD